MYGHWQVEAFLQRLRNGEVGAVDEFQLDDSVLWKRKKPASFEAGGPTPRPTQRPPAGPMRPLTGDSDGDDDMLGPPERGPKPHSGASAGAGPGFGQFRYNSGGSSEKGVSGSQKGFLAGEQHPIGTMGVSQGTGVCAGHSSGSSGGWRKKSGASSDGW